MEDDINDLPGFAKKDAQANVLQRKKSKCRNFSGRKETKRVNPNCTQKNIMAMFQN